MTKSLNIFIWILGISWLGLSSGTCQLSWKGGFHVGPTLKMNSTFPESTQSSKMYEFGVELPTKGKEPWHERYGYPRIGISALYGSFGNPEVLGRAYSIFPHLMFRLSKPNSNWKWQFLAGTSFAYVDRRFDRQTNPTNNATGANLHSFTLVRIKLGRVISEKWMPYVAGSFFHFSNARVRVPNLGLNVPSLGVGLTYSPDDTFIPPMPGKDTARFRWSPGLKLGLGFTSSKVSDGPLFPVYLADVWVNYHWRSKLRLRAGTTWFYSESAYTFIKETGALGTLVDDITWASTGGAIFVGSEFLMGHFSFIAQLGPYLKKPYDQPYSLYTKMGLQFYLKDQQLHPRNQVFLGMYVHSHSGEADFGEWSIGFVF